MSDELVVAAPEAPPKEVQAPVETGTGEVDATVQQATEQGWRPKEEWVANGGDPDEWKSAKLFVKDGELYKSLHSIKREQKQTQAALTALQNHHKVVYEKAHQQAVQDLKLQRRQALRSEDLETVEQIEEKIEKLQEEHVQTSKQLQQAENAAQSVTGTQAEFEVFLQRNPWYTSDSNLKDEADAIGFIYLNKGGARENLLPHVEKEIRRKFPEKFGIKRAAPNAVAPVSKQQAQSKADTFELDDTEREIMNTFVRSGVMTKEQYIADLKKVKGRS